MPVRKIKSDINDMLQTVLALLILGAVIEVTGTVFFGVNLLPFILTIIIVTLILKGLYSDKRTLRWIENKLNRIFK